MFLVVLVVLSVVLSSNAQALLLSDIMKSCGTNNGCSVCFNRLVYEAIRTSENQYNLQKTFYPPNKETPVYVIVKYSYIDDNGVIMTLNNTWFWTTSAYYLYQPPAVLQFTSLFFADPAFRSARLNLTLPIDCMKAGTDFMQLLTQRVSSIVDRCCHLSQSTSCP